MIRYFGIATSLVLAASCGGKIDIAPDAEAPPVDAPDSDAALPSTDASAGVTFGTTDGAATVGCNTLEQVGDPVTLGRGADAPPTPTGGTISSAEYTLKTATYYGPGAPGDTVIGQVTFEITDKTANIVVNSDSQNMRSTATVTVAGPTSLTFTTSCAYDGAGADAGVSLPARADYTSAAGVLTLFVTPDGAPDVVIVEEFATLPVHMR